MFKFLKEKVGKIYNKFTKKISSIFTNNSLDEKFLKELKILLLSADTGVRATNKIIDSLRVKINSQKITNMEQVKTELEIQLVKILEQNTMKFPSSGIIMLVGINGTGKTTFAAKLANKLKNENKKVLLVAADTFRAAAVEQLNNWAQKINVEIFLPKQNSDPASVIFDGVTKYKNENYDYVIIDTAGRLQTKVNLMKELTKITRVINKVVADEKPYSLLTVDAMLGQNSFQQAEVFKQAINLAGVVLTKIDGTGKGGIVFSIAENLNLPISFITFGENINDIKEFNAKDFVTDLISE